MRKCEIILVLALAALPGCSNEAIYNTVQGHHQFECQKDLQPVWEECMKHASEPYEDYKKSREEVLIDKK